MCQVVCKNDILEQFLDVLSEIDLFVQIEEENGDGTQTECLRGHQLAQLAAEELENKGKVPSLK